MRPPLTLSRRVPRATQAVPWVAAFVIGLTVATCRDNPVGPRRDGGGPASIAIRPVVPAHVELQGFGLTIDSLRVVVVHAPADTLRDTTSYFSPDSNQIHLGLSLLLSEPSETLSVHLILSAQGVPLFTGSQQAIVAVGASSSNTPPINITMNFTGPGAGVTTLHLTPVDSVLHFSDSLRFRVTADSAGVPVAAFYTKWTTSDTLAARINAFGILHAPASRKSVYVVVRTYSGAADSTPVTFIPTPTSLAIQTGNTQIGTVGIALPLALKVRVTAADGLGVKGIPVQFSVLTGGGSVSPTTVVVTDTGGFAQGTATLGTLAGAASFQASAPGLTAVTFNVTAKAGLPTQLLANTGLGQTVVAGLLVPIAPSVVAKDTFNNVVPGVAVTWSVPGGHGQITTTAASDSTNGSGIATIGSWTIDTLVRVDSLTATVGALSRVFTATGIAGAISALTSNITPVGLDTLASGLTSTFTLHGRDKYGNPLTSGGTPPVFSLVGGTSTGSLSSVTDHGDGTYSVTVTGLAVGLATTLHATIGGTALGTTLPTILVVPGVALADSSVVTVKNAVDSSGAGDSVTLKTRDSHGNPLTTGGLTVIFSTNGGLSTGAFSPTVDHGNGTYTSVFTGIKAGTATFIKASVGGTSVNPTLPSIQVVPGVASIDSSTVTIGQGTLSVGAKTLLHLQARDAAGNNLTAGGSAVVFSLTGGTSLATLTPATAHDNLDGTYTDTLVATVPGTAATVHATLGGTAITASVSITVVLGTGLNQSLVTADSATIASGDSTLVHLQARDSLLNNILSGGLTVAFSDSNGTFGSTTDHGNGTYTAVFHAMQAGVSTIHATINGLPVTFTLPAITVTAGAASPATSVVTVPIDSVASGASLLFTIQLKDAAGNALTTAGGATVVFSTAFGSSTGTIAPSPAVFAGAGTDTARFTGVLAGTLDTIKATLNGQPVTTARPTIRVFPGAFSLATSTVTVTDSVVAAGGIDTLILTTRDAAGNLLGKGGLTVAFTLAGGTSTGSIGGTADLGNGTYRAIFTGVNAGTAVSVGATIGGSPVTSVLPTIRVNTTVHVSNILADSVWTAVASPHIVRGLLKIANGATLTIQPGALVKFDTASGLQVGDTAAGQAGGLSLAGTALQPITLTADSTAIRPGFWKGIEVQRLLAPTTWTHVLIEGAGGARPVPTAQSCLLTVNNQGAALVADSLRVRGCLNGGIEAWGGTLTVRRSRVDTVSGPGIQALVSGTLMLDTTSIRGAGNIGLSMGPVGATGPFLGGFAAGNKFIGNGGAAVAIQATNLARFGPQDSIAQNGSDAVVVGGGNVDSTITAFTLSRLLPGGAYQIQGLLHVGASAGMTMTLDSNVVIGFFTQSGLVIGDSGGARTGMLKTLATGSSNGALLTSVAVAAPGSWTGLEFGNLSGPDTVVGLHIQYAGDSIPGYTTRRAGIWVRNASANELVLTGAALASNGSTASPNNAAGIIVTGSGGGVHIYGTNVSGTAGFGFAYQTPGVRLVGDTALGSAVSGLGIFTGLTGALSPADSVAFSRFSGSTLYPATVPLGAIPAIYAGTNSFSGNGRDTLVLQGGVLSGQSVTVPRVHAVPWRVVAPLSVGGGGTLAFAAGDSVSLDSAVAIFVGDTLAGSGSLHAIAPDTAPILFQPTPGLQYWHGITYINSVGDTSLRNVTVDGAGFFQPCPLIDCLGQKMGAIRVLASPTANLVFDSITIRNSPFYAIQALAPATPGGVVVSHSQFYRNSSPVVFLASTGPALTIDSSDIYAYRAPAGASVIANTDGTLDTIVARHNWWGDVAGPGRVANGLADSLGRTLIDTLASGIAYAPFATAPYFPVGPEAAATPVADSLVFCCSAVAGLPLPDSIRVRALDANGRGVGGQFVGWAAAAGSGSVLGSSPTDIGGRVGAFWTPTTVAKFDSAQASVGGHTANFFVQIFPAPLASVHWKYVPGLTEGTVSAAFDTALFTASGHVGTIVTNAVDAFGNAVSPQNLYFDTLPGTFVPRNYGAVTKLSGDTIFFVDTADVGAPFQLHGTYTTSTGQVEDSVIVETNWVPFGVRITPDTVRINAICPVGVPGNVFCSRPVTAQFFDSAGGTMPPNGQATFFWSASGPISIDSTGGPSLMTAFITARDTGTGTILATHTGPLFQDTAVAPVIARQVMGQIGVTPDTLSTGIGDTVAFHATAADSGGTLLKTQPSFQWQVTSQFPGLIKLDSAADSLQVRFDSGVFSFGQFKWVGVARPFVERVPGDTVFGQGTLFNPIAYNVVGSGTSIGAQSRAAVDTVTNKTFYTSSGNQTVYVNDNTTNGIVAGITVGFSPIWLTVSHAGGADKVYVSNNTSGTVSVINPTTDQVTSTITLPLTSEPFGITAADALGRVYVAARYCPGTPGLCTTEVAVLPIDVAGDSVVTADIVKLNTDSLRFPQGLTFNPNNKLLYVAMDSGYVKVVDPSTKAETGTILVQAGFTLSDVAVNPVTDTLYVSDVPGQEIAVIDPVTAAVVNFIPANSPQGIGVDPAHNRIYYASSGNQSVVEIDGATETFHQLIVGGSGDNPQDAQPDPRTGTVYAPHFTALTALQFYGKPVGQALGAPPVRFAPKATRLAPMTPPPPTPAPAKPVVRPRARPAPKPPASRTPTNAAASKQPQ